MVIERQEIWWTKTRPVLVVQSNSFNRSRLGTVVVVPLTSNLRLLDAPGNVLIPRGQSKLAKDSVVNVSLVRALDRSLLVERVTRISKDRMREVDDGLKLVLDL